MEFPMKTLVTTLAILTLSSAPLVAKDGTFTSAIIPDGGGELRLNLSSHEWLKITNFTQIPVNDAIPTKAAGVAVFKGDNGLWVLFASDPRSDVVHKDLFVGGPATVVIVPPKVDSGYGGATVFVTYQRGSD